MHGRVKAFLESGLVASGVARLARRRFQGRTLILAYHNIVPAGLSPVGESSLHLPEEVFTAQLDALLRTHDVVPLSSILGHRPLPARRPRVVITFDDAYRGAVTAGIRALARRGLPATVFVCPGFVGSRENTFWWDSLCRHGSAGLSEGDRHEALTTHQGDDTAVRRWALSSGYGTQPVPWYASVASEKDLEAAVRSAGITLGSHSWSHRNLAALDAQRLADELARPLQWLRARFHPVEEVLAYPYGLASPAVERATAAAGYRAGLRISGGWIRDHAPTPYATPRLNVPAGLSPNGFALRVSGILVQ
jgi:peptidoglycan/xylan/chitin deacetylase (PgdA/CDA1 family)